MAMPEEIAIDLQAEMVSVVEAQDAIAACIPEIGKLAWKFFAITRDLGVVEKDDDFALERPGPEHLRWFVSESVLGMYYKLLELIPDIRKGAEATEARLLTNWEKVQKFETHREESNKLRICACG
jgi:hypothetical protein